MGEPLLLVDSLSKTYGARRAWPFARAAPPRPALTRVSFALDRGETIGIVGESGSGKSTLARCIAMLERPDTGRVIFAGEDLGRLSPSALRAGRRRIQTIFQDPYGSLNPRQRVGDTLAEVLLVHRLVPRERVAARVAMLLDQVGLPASAAGRLPSAFSGGQRQRICIARALAAEPELIIADEPVSALDVSVRAQVVNLLVDLNRDLGLAMIFIGHDLILVDHVAPRMAVMLGGQIVELVPDHGGLTGARHPYTRALLAAVPRLDAPLAARAAGAAGDLTADLPRDGCPFAARCPERVEGRCDRGTIATVEIAPGHLVACVHADPRDQLRQCVSSGAAHV